MRFVGNSLDNIPEAFAHFRGHIYTVGLLHEIAYAALSRLGVDADNIALVFASHIVRVYGYIGNGPFFGFLFLAPLHSLCDRVLVRAAESRVNELSAVRHALVYLHSGKALICFGELGQI